MKIHLAIGLLCLFTTAAMAQRGGGHAGAGGFRGGSSGISSSRGGFAGGGYRGGGFGGYGGYGGFRGSYGYRGSYGHRGFSFGLGYYPWYGYSFWPGYGGGYYSYSDPAVSDYNPPPQVTVVYPPPSQPAYNLYVAPTQGGYDQYGQPIAAAPAPEAAPEASPTPEPGRSPIYLIAFKDHTIRAAESYSVSGDTLHYFTLEHQEKQAPLASVDRALSAQLNRERHVVFMLPNQ
jgi:hypothetical protein